MISFNDYDDICEPTIAKRKQRCEVWFTRDDRFNARLDWRGFVVKSAVVELRLILVYDASFKYVSTDFLYFSLVTFIMYTVVVTGG